MDGSPVIAGLYGVHKYFDSLFGGDSIWALRNVTFGVRRGEVLGLLGPPDAGKTTALRILAGELGPTDGKARVFGRSPRRKSARSRIGHLAQATGNQRSQPPRGFIALLNGLFRPQASSGRRSKPLAEATGLQRRARLQKILAAKPDLVLLDEPFAALDLASCRRMQDCIVELARQGRTVILSDTSLLHVKDVCHRIAVLSGGRIEAIGALSDLFATRENLACLSRLLPSRTAELALHTIREDLDITRASAPPRAEPVRPVGRPAQTDADSILNQLAGKRSPDEPAQPSSSLVNHSLLATLTRGTNPAPPAPQGPTTPSDENTKDALRDLQTPDA